MATANQIYTILNAVAKQQYGAAAVTVVDTSSMVSLGNNVLSSDESKDAFMGQLTDRIGKTIFSVRAYEGTDPNVVKHSFDFGVALQKIYVDLPDTEENSSWLVGEEDFTPEFAPVIKPTVREKLFVSMNTFEIDVTIPDTLLKTAFLNEVGMATMIDAIFMAVENRLEVAMESMINLTRASFIARKLNAEKECGAINLLKSYNEQFNQTLTAQAALYTPDFLRYASSQISLWTKRMRKMSSLFNDEEVSSGNGYKRHTPAEDLVLTVLDDFAETTASYLQADTFHKELVALPRYNTVPYWQGSGTSFSFTSASTVNVKLSETLTVNQSGVIAVAYDYQALGTMINREYTTTQYNGRAQYTDYYNKIERGMFNDMSENGIVFYIADTPSARTKAS